MFINRAIYTVVFLILFAFFIFSQSWISFFLLIISICIPLISLFGMLLSARKTSISASVPDRILRGGDGSLTVVCDCASPFPFAHALVVVDLTDSISYTPEQTYVISSGERLSIPLFTDFCTQINISFKKCCICDMLGLFTLTRRHNALSSCILPRQLPIAPLPRIMREEEETTILRPGRTISENYDVREYRPGDRLRDIHWKLSAKYDKYIVREALESLRSNVTIAVDIGTEPTENDTIMDKLSYLTGLLLEKGCCIRIIWSAPPSGTVYEAFVSDQGTLFAMWKRILSISPCRYNEEPVYKACDTPTFYHLKRGAAQ